MIDLYSGFLVFDFLHIQIGDFGLMYWICAGEFESKTRRHDACEFKFRF